MICIEGIVYTMEREVAPRPCKIHDWLLNSSRDHLGLHQGQNVKVIMEFEVPKRHIRGPTLSIDMVQSVCSVRGKTRALVEKGKGPWQRNIAIINLERKSFSG